MSPKEIEHLLYYDCGLKGLSGISNDVRELLVSPDPRAQLALEYFVHRIVLSTGMLAAAMDGIDAFVFTAGIGENSPAIREAVLRRLSWLASSSPPGRTKRTSAGSRASGRGLPATSFRPTKN